MYYSMPINMFFIVKNHWEPYFTDNLRIMYILTDYRLILTKETKDKPDLSSERADSNGTALARTSRNSKLQALPLVREGATK
jgi:hypothetical protein